MDKVFKNKEGFTLIELLVSIGLASILLSLIVSFLVMNINNFDRSQKEIDLQHEGQHIINYIKDITMEGKNISYIKNINNEIKTSSKTFVNTKEIRVITKVIDRNILNVTTNEQILTIDRKDRKIYHGSKEVGRYIDEVIVGTIPSNKNFSEAKGITLTLNLVSGNLKKSVTSQIFFRNHDR